MLTMLLARKRSGQGLSLTTIVIAAIALIVLVVLIAIFTGKLKIFSTGSDEVKRGAVRQLCADPTTGNYCATAGSCAQTGVYPENPGEWIDCGNEGCCRP